MFEDEKSGSVGRRPTTSACIVLLRLQIRVSMDEEYVEREEEEDQEPSASG